MDLNQSVGWAVTILVSAGVGWGAAKRAVGGRTLAKIIERVTEENSIERHPVVLVAADEARAAPLRTTLVDRGFRTVSLATSEYRGSGAAVVVLADGLDLVGFANRSGLAEGLIYSRGRIEQSQTPPGDWTFANSPITLFARLAELIRWQRASSSRPSS